MRVRDMEIGSLVECSKCRLEIPLTARMKKIESRICGACASKDAVDWAKANRDKKRASNAKYLRSISDQRSVYTATYRANHPERRAAHQAVQTATRNGSLVKCPCEVCGGAVAHAHHDDYSKPLEVNWLCHRHHMERHSMLEARDK